MKILILSNLLTAALISLAFTASIAWAYHDGSLVNNADYLASIDNELSNKKC